VQQVLLALGLAIAAAWQANRKHRTFAHLARHGHVAAHHACELAREGKAEPGSTVAARSERIGLAAVSNRSKVALFDHLARGDRR